MTLTYNGIQRKRKIVVFFDICSSTTTLEALLRTETEECWRDLVIVIKNFLFKEGEHCHFLIYKFWDDSWVLLFDREQIKGTVFT